MTDKIQIISGNLNKFKNWVNKLIRVKDTGNLFVGTDTGLITTGNYNIFMGYQAGYYNTSGYSNNYVGYQAGYYNTSGYYNNYVGYAAGYSNTTGNFNNCVGFAAGYYETGNNKLFIDNASRANEADGRVKALLYGVFDAATANQRLSINAQLLVREVATYADDATAGAGGLVTGELYKHADGSLHIKL